MGWKQLGAGVAITFLLTGGCAPQGERIRPWIGLAEISDQIIRGGEDDALLMAAEPLGGETQAGQTPRVRELAAGENGRNPWLDLIRPLEPAPEREVAEGVLLNFDDADIREVIRVVAENLNLNYVIDPRVSGVVSIRTTRPIPENELLAVLRKLLNINGLDIIPEGYHYYIHATPNPGVRQVYPPGQIKGLQSSPHMIMQVVPLLYLSSSQALNLISPYLSEQGLTFELREQNMIIISDYESMVTEIIQILSHIDVSPLANFAMRLVRIENAPLFDLHDELRELLGAMRISNREQGSDIIDVVPLERVNSLLLISRSESLLDNVGNWIEALDVIPVNGRDSIFLYNVRNSVASELADLVNTLLAEQEPGGVRPRQLTPAPAQGAQRAPAQVARPAVTSERPPAAGLQLTEGSLLIADDTRNIILIRGLPSDYRRLMKILERLDTLPRQVLIEVVVAEVTLSDRFEFGVEWAIKNKDLSINSTEYEQRLRSANFTNLDPRGLTGLTYSILRSADDVRGLLNALASDTDVSILSSPQILVLNNEAASINVGDQVPIVTSEVVPTGTEGTTLTRSIQYRDTGVILNVIPRINYDGIIILEIDQQVSNAIAGISAQLGLNSPVITTRQLRTKLAVKDGQSIMMGGMIRKDTNSVETGVPLLKNIPVLGWLFKSQTETTTRTELLVMITPHVIESRNVLDQYFRSFSGKMSELRQELTKEGR
jgi:general secretion pathway protein D